jgi:hypothetical protein
MIPEIDTQLSAVIKSLQDNVLPAVDQNNAQAIEQLQLSLVTLGVIKGRLPMSHQYQRRELELNLALVKSLAEIADQGSIDLENTSAKGISALIWESEEIISESFYGAQELEQQVRGLKDIAAQVVNAARGLSIEAEVTSMILKSQQDMDLCRRSWALDMGFEPDPSQVPPLEQLLDEVATTS